MEPADADSSRFMGELDENLKENLERNFIPVVEEDLKTLGISEIALSTYYAGEIKLVKEHLERKGYDVDFIPRHDRGTNGDISSPTIYAVLRRTSY